MKRKCTRSLILSLFLLVGAVSAHAASESYTEILKKRDAVLSQILREQEGRRATGHSVDEEIFAAQIALYSFRRDSSSTSAEKIKNQELVVSAHEKRLEVFKTKSQTGGVANVEVLRVTDGVLEAKQVLEELRARSKTG